MGSYILMPAFGSRFLATICQAPFHWPLDGETQHSRRLCMQAQSEGFIPNKYHPDKLRQGEEKLLTKIQGLKELLVFLSGTGHETRENIWPAPSFLAPNTWKALLSFFFIFTSIHSHCPTILVRLVCA